MSTADIIRAKQREEQNKAKWLEVNPFLPDTRGIYILTREENGFRYAYIGQAKHILTRLAQHLEGYEQHIDRSLKNHGLHSATNPTGWFVTAKQFAEDELDEYEKKYIKQYADLGYKQCWGIKNNESRIRLFFT